MLPEPDFAERHARRIAAAADTVWEALHAVSLADLLLARALMAVRSLPSRLMGPDDRDPLVSGRLLGGPVPVLVSDPPHTVVAGTVGRPWRMRDASQPPPLDGAALRAFSRPGRVRVGLGFTLEPDGDGTILHTETRVGATDARTRQLFWLYWLAIRPGSGLIRRELLRWVARRAEAQSFSTRPEAGHDPDHFGGRVSGSSSPSRLRGE